MYELGVELDSDGRRQHFANEVFASRWLSDTAQPTVKSEGDSLRQRNKEESDCKMYAIQST